MKNLLNPRWIIAINTLPICVLLFLLNSQFQIIKSLLEEKDLLVWRNVIITIISIAVINLAAAIYFIVKKQNIPRYFSFTSLLIHIAFIYTYAMFAENIIPFSIPDWMISGNIVLYAGTFLMPSILHSIFVLVLHYTQNTENYKPWKSFLTSILIPVLVYGFGILVIPLWKNIPYQYQDHLYVVIIIICTIIFLFFVIRTLYILSYKESTIWKKYPLIWKIPFCIIFPLLGLLLNNGLLTSRSGYNGYGIFGDFSNLWFYILAVLNGLILCLPRFENQQLNLGIFVAKSICFAFTFYFFLVFLPFLPLSVIAIFAFATGILMLTPLVLLVIHVESLSKSFAHLKKTFKKQHLYILAICSFLIIPFCIHLTFLKDKNVLNETLEFIYDPNYSKEYSIDKISLANTLKTVENNKRSNILNGDFGNSTPYISSYFKWLVLDNMTLSFNKINKIKQIFFGVENKIFNDSEFKNPQVQISNIETKSTFDESQKIYKTWVDFEIKNHTNSSIAEYITEFELPEACWISDYYLYVGDRKEEGILAEKKSAMWVYTQIRNRNRDPGLLHYMNGNKIKFKIFPFQSQELRKSGIQFIHKEPLSITIDDHEIHLAKDKPSHAELIDEANFAYIPKEEKQNLQLVNREKYLHFIVDVSGNTPDSTRSIEQRILNFVAENKHNLQDAKISFCNSDSKTIPFDENWQKAFKNQAFESGFYLDRAIKKALIESQDHPKKPMIIVVSDNMRKAIIKDNFTDFEFLYPDFDHFFQLDEMGNLKSHSLTLHSIISEELNVDSLLNKQAYQFKSKDDKTYFLPADTSSNLIYKKDFIDQSEDLINEKEWQSGLIMEGMRRSQILHPEYGTSEWLQLVKFSFKSHIMSPVTSFMVVENEAQKAMLLKKQKLVLSGNKNLDLSDDMQRMSEPQYIITALLFLAFYYFRRRRKLARV